MLSPNHRAKRGAGGPVGSKLKTQVSSVPEHTSLEESKSSGQLTMRLMSQSDIAEVMRWMDEEGWSPGINDSYAYSQIDPSGGLFMLFKKDQRIGSMSAVKYDSKFAFGGMLIVREPLRGKGYGKLLWEAGLNYAKSCDSIGLYAVPAMRQRYKALGFTHELYNTKRCEFTVPESMGESPVPRPKQHLGFLLKQIVDYDKKVFPSSRERVLEGLLGRFDTHAYVVEGPDGKPNGYGILRPCTNCYRLSLFADDVEVAQEIAETLIRQVAPGSRIIMDLPDNNSHGKDFIEALGFKEVPDHETTLMIKGTVPPVYQKARNITYAVLSLEVG